MEGIYSWEIYLQSDILYGLVWKLFILGRFIYKLASYMVWCGRYLYLGDLSSYIVEGRNPGSFQPPENTGSLLIEGCDRWNRTNFENFWYIIKCHFQGGATKQIAQFSGKLAKPYSS